jgi:hypothetical protein
MLGNAVGAAMTKKKISYEQFDNFSVDDETNQLYWRDKPVVTAISLPTWLQIAALAGGIGGGVSAIVAIIRLDWKIGKAKVSLP